MHASRHHRGVGGYFGCTSGYISEHLSPQHNEAPCEEETWIYSYVRF